MGGANLLFATTPGDQRAHGGLAAGRAAVQRDCRQAPGRGVDMGRARAWRSAHAWMGEPGRAVRGPGRRAAGEWTSRRDVRCARTRGIAGSAQLGPEFARAAIAVAAAVGPVSAVVGHSLGGFAAALAMDRGLAARRAVLISPSANANSYSAQFAALLGVAAPVMSSMRERLARRLDFAWDEMDVPAFAPAMRVPLLVIHDRDDRDVRWNDGAAIAQAWPGAELVTTSGLGHHRIVSDSGVIRQVVSFLRQTAQ